MLHAAPVLEHRHDLEIGAQHEQPEDGRAIEGNRHAEDDDGRIGGTDQPRRIIRVIALTRDFQPVILGQLRTDEVAEQTRQADENDPRCVQGSRPVRGVTHSGDPLSLRP
jgi:hypothetical protein